MKRWIPLHIKLIVLLATVLILYFFKPFAQEERGRQENDFDTWLRASGESLMRSPGPETPMVQLRARSMHPDQQFVLELASSDNFDLNRKLYRLLRQAREASLFELDRRGEADFELEVKFGEKAFVSRFSKEDMQKNVKIATFMLLLREFAQEKIKDTGSSAS